MGGHLSRWSQWGLSGNVAMRSQEEDGRQRPAVVSSQQLALLGSTVTLRQGRGDGRKHVGNPKWDIVAMVWSLGLHSPVVQVSFGLI